MESMGDWLKNEFEAGPDSFVITNTKADLMLHRVRSGQLLSHFHP